MWSKPKLIRIRNKVGNSKTRREKKKKKKRPTIRSEILKTALKGPPRGVGYILTVCCTITRLCQDLSIIPELIYIYLIFESIITIQYTSC